MSRKVQGQNGEKAPRGRMTFHGLGHDVRYALRQLWRYPVGNGVMVLTVAVLVGAVSVLYASLQDQRLRLVPFPDPGRVVSLWRIGAQRPVVFFPADLFHAWRDRTQSYEALGAVRGMGRQTLAGVGDPVSYRAFGVTPDILRITAPRPVRGRLFDEREYLESAADVVVISEQMWREKLEEDPDIVGRELRLNDRACTVIGVMPAAMHTTCVGFGVDLWHPTRLDPGESDTLVRIVGRLKRGVSLEQAQSELDALSPRIERQHTPTERERQRNPGGFTATRVVPALRVLGADDGFPARLVLMLVSAGVLLCCVVGIACFNVTNLLLARAAARSREMTIRLSLGAGRLRIVRQLLTETVLLALFGGALGLVAACWFAGLLRLQQVDPSLDWRMYLIAVSGALLLGVLIGLVPALRSARLNLVESLKQGGTAAGGRRRHRMRDFLVASEIAMASVLCLVGGRLAGGLAEFHRGDLGFDSDRVLSVWVQLRPDRNLSADDQLAYAERGLRALRGLSGVEQASLCLSYDWTRFEGSDPFRLAGRTGEEDRDIQATVYRVDPRFPDLLGMPLVRGRDLPMTGGRGPGEVLVNETFANRYFPDADPLGRRVVPRDGAEELTIVGVVRDRLPRTSYRPVAPELFRDFRGDFFSGYGILFFARTRARAAAMAPAVREAIAAVDLDQPVNAPETLANTLDRRMAYLRGPTLIWSLLAGAGLLIALAGLYGVVSYAVVERTREIGIRMAVGATPGRIVRLMAWQGFRLAVVGGSLGMVAGMAISSGGWLQTVTGGVASGLPSTAVGVALLIGAVSLCASLLPARHAFSIHPAEALRTE